MAETPIPLPVHAATAKGGGAASTERARWA